MEIALMWSELVALGQVIVIDLVLAGDNAIVVGMAAAALPPEVRRKVIIIGIAAATVIRIVFALLANHLLTLFGLLLAGGLLLLWVSWKFWRELAHQRRLRIAKALQRQEPVSGDDVLKLARPKPALPGIPGKTTSQAVWQIIIADVSMSLDNVLAVAGAAGEHGWVLVFGLVLSVALMGTIATLIANLLKRYHWIAYIGFAIVLWVALDMIWRGAIAIIEASFH
jgi:YjbE family integral membrane protein